MFVCLSSAARPEYARDILRALAMPAGAQLQFRYERSLIAASIDLKLESSPEEFREKECLICFIDQSDRAKEPEIIPCRLASLVSARLHGTTCSLTFMLGEFAYAPDLPTFRNELANVAANTLPRWGTREYPEGKYWLDITQNASDLRQIQYTSGHWINKLGTWEKIVGQIMNRKGFEQEPVFFTMDGIRRIRDNQEWKFENGVLPLNPGSDYESRIYHYVVRPTFQPSQLCVTIAGKGIEPISGMVLPIESEYDWMYFRIRTSRPSTEETAILNIARADATGKPEWSFNITTQTKPSHLAIWGWGLAVGVLLTVPQAYAAWNDTNLANNVNVPILAFLANIVAGIMAAYGFRRSF
jgi:hypothetical protein